MEKVKKSTGRNLDLRLKNNLSQADVRRREMENGKRYLLVFRFMKLDLCELIFLDNIQYYSFSIRFNQYNF